MSKLQLIKRMVWSVYLTFVLRLALGGVLATAGVIKLSQNDELLEAIEEHEILPSLLEVWLAASLPWIELIVAALLFIGLFKRLGAVVSFLLALMFIIANGVALNHGLDYGCGCFGDLLRFDHDEALMIDIFMMLAAVQIVLQKNDFLSLDLWRARRRELTQV
ncbi:MAG: MauE/DoxX family redox-associated membrane protein [Chloroflexota bacterium]|nr:MauE/DoxX family redox-associated membrane protein [Chloroflexota bacterium]